VREFNKRIVFEITLELYLYLYVKYSIQTMIFWSLCAFIWFKNIEKMLLQITSAFLQLKSTIGHVLFIYRTTSDFNFIEIIMKVQL
jgi:hypothetical protein